MEVNITMINALSIDVSMGTNIDHFESDQNKFVRYGVDNGVLIVEERPHENLKYSSLKPRRFLFSGPMKVVIVL